MRFPRPRNKQCVEATQSGSGADMRVCAPLTHHTSPPQAGFLLLLALPDADPCGSAISFGTRARVQAKCHWPGHSSVA
jgi:hypothetical protein